MNEHEFDQRINNLSVDEQNEFHTRITAIMSETRSIFAGYAKTAFMWLSVSVLCIIYGFWLNLESGLIASAVCAVVTARGWKYLRKQAVVIAILRLIQIIQLLRELSFADNEIRDTFQIFNLDHRDKDYANAIIATAFDHA